ncbi:DUF397 domain-containing protein [Streptomyces sp. NPDC051940]|uniref:DUF397 domain-containing protein n=1 Tax=Streptomyces sp. NPDC051940 TaxID=3155675 RepID=UPI003424E3DC
MSIQQGDTREWVKSSYSAGNGACVEVKSPLTSLVSVRDSKDPDGPALDFGPESWAAFVTAVNGGEFGTV